MKFVAFINCVLIVLAFSSPAAVRARQVANPADVRLRLAQSYARSGDFASAVKILTEILRTDPTNPLVLEELRHDYMELKRYPEAISLLKDQIARRRTDINAISQLASVYYLNSQEDSAYATWESIISANPKQMISYHMVGGTMTQSRLFDRAIAVYLRGRAACGDPSLFITEVAYLYTVTGRYAEATREYLSMLKISASQLGSVQGSIATYTNRPEGLAAATTVIEEAAHGAQSDIMLKRLLAWVYMEGKRYEQAYDVCAAIDDAAKAGGGELHIFADRARHDHAFATAAKAYRHIIDRYPKYVNGAQVRLGYAEALDASTEEQDTLRLYGNDHPFRNGTTQAADPATLYAGPLKAYQEILTLYPGTEIAAQALLRIGTIQDDKLEDHSAAESSFEKILTTYSSFPGETSEAALKLGDVYVSLDRFEPARDQYTRIVRGGVKGLPLQQEATLRLAELLYYEGQFDSSLTVLRDLTANTSSDAANDAIGLQILIQQNLQAEKPALTAYAKAERLRRQHKWDDAIAILTNFPHAFPQSELRDEALMAAGDIYTVTARYPEAIAAYDTLIAQFPKSIALDQTLMKLAGVYERGLRDSGKAIMTYERILGDFPSSIYVPEARQRIRSLRGDTL